MTVATDRTIDNALDVGRKIPATALELRVEKIAGPDAVGAAPANAVTLSQRASSIVDIRSTVTASGAAGAVLAPLAGTHYGLQGAVLTNPSAVDFSAETWLVTYLADADQGGQSSVTP